MAGTIEFDDEEILSKQQRYKAALHHSVGMACEDVGKKEDLQFTREAVAVINETVYRHIETLGGDLEAFATHGKRKVITPDDVKLCCRRNPDLLKLVQGWADLLKSKKEPSGAGGGQPKGTRRKGKGKKVLLDSDSDIEEL